MEERGPICFNEREIGNIRINILVKEFRKFFNLTEHLGREVIDDCPTMVQGEEDIMEVLAGSNRSGS